MRDGLKVASARGVTAIHDKDGWLPSIPRLWQELERDGALPVRVWQSIPHDRLDGVAAAGLASGLGSDRLRLGYLKVFMDGTLGSQTALMTDGAGVEITSHEELADILRRSARARWPVAVHAIGDLANANALDAFEETRDEWQPLGLRHRMEHAQCLRPGDVGRFADLGLTASVQFSHAPSDEELAKRFWADRLERRVLVPRSARGGRAFDQRFRRADRGARPVGRALRRRPRPLARRPACDASRRRSSPQPSRPPGRPTTSAAAGSSSPATSPTSWFSTATRSRSRPKSFPRCRPVATMVGGRWTHNPPPW